jgi:hypothetical protein
VDAEYEPRGLNTRIEQSYAPGTSGDWGLGSKQRFTSTYQYGGEQPHSMTNFWRRNHFLPH